MIHCESSKSLNSILTHSIQKHLTLSLNLWILTECLMLLTRNRKYSVRAIALVAFCVLKYQKLQNSLFEFS